MGTERPAGVKERNPAQHEEITGRIPMKNRGAGRDPCGLAVFPASESAGCLAGAVMSVDGGFPAK